MPRHNRIRRRLSLPVTERQPANPNETWTQGARFATGWQDFVTFGLFGDGMHRCQNDAIRIAGYLAAKAAWDAHHHATNWIEIEGGQG